MFWLGFGIYTMIMVVVWGFFVVAKMHVYKFKDYSHLVGPMTKLLAFLLIILTILGYYFLYRGFSTDTVTTKTVQDQTSKEVY